MDQQVLTTIALIEASTLSQVDQEYFVAALKRNGLTPELEKEILTALKTAAVELKTPASVSTDDDAEDQFIILENERERRTQALDDQFAPRFHTLEKQMSALQKEYDDALAALNAEIDTQLATVSSS